MNILDENIDDPQRLLLRRWRIAVRQIGHDVGRKAMTDQDVIPLLLQLRRPTLFTRDRDFSRPRLRHARYGLVWLDVGEHEVAEYVCRVLRHSEFNTQAKRMGCLIGASQARLFVWRLHAEHAERIPWDE